MRTHDGPPRGTALAALLGLALAGCGGGEPADDAIRPPAWAAADEPSLAIEGGQAGFGLIAGALRLGDGTFAVADAQERRVRRFSADGSELAAVGGPGGGPGEFESLDALWADASDSFAAWDARLGRYTVFGADGAMGRIVELERTGERVRSAPLGVADTGELIVLDDPRTLSDEETYRPELLLRVYGPDGIVARTIATIPGPDMWNWAHDRGVTPAAVPFGRTTHVALAGDRLYVGTNDAYEIQILDLGGASMGAIELRRDALPLRQAAIEDYKAAEREKAASSAASKGGNEVFGLLAEAAPYPERYPFYDAIVVDDAGNVWVRDVNVALPSHTTYVVFDADGGLVATAELPPRFRVTEISDGAALGVWRDRLDVEQVRLYPVRPKP